MKLKLDINKEYALALEGGKVFRGDGPSKYLKFIVAPALEL